MLAGSPRPVRSSSDTFRPGLAPAALLIKGARVGRKWSGSAGWLVLALLSLGTGAARGDEPALEFNRDIRPILSENCFACHGPDARKRQAGLRLDVEAEAAKALESGTRAIVAGHPEQSELIERLVSADPSEVMPPPETGKKLTPEQIALLKRWIAEGAKWQGHWAFLPIRRPAPPFVPVDPAFVKGPIDAFLAKGLAAQKLEHAPLADRVTLLRRAHFDLTGLPPTPEEANRFLSDEAPDAFERLVDRLLDSPHYGERMAMLWLDLVRYADTVGYHGDQPMAVSPFRDYVIDSFNANKPFDQFTLEQLGGDLLPNPTREQKIAAGYNRLGMMSAEGGVQDREYLAKYIAERVRNVSGAWLGVTLGCSECHDHKFDPFSTREFYQMEAFFADIQERGLYSGSNDSGAWGPSMLVPAPDEEAQQQGLEKRIAELRARLDQPTPELEQEQRQWEAEAVAEGKWQPLPLLTATAEKGTQLRVLEDRSVLAGGETPATDTYTVEAQLPLAGITGLRLEVLPHESLPQRGPGRAGNGNFVLTELEAFVVAEGAEPMPVALQNGTATIEQKSSAEKHPDKAWSAASVIDGDKRGAEWGWAILDEAGTAHNVAFETVNAVDLPANARLRIVLKQLHPNPGHVLGRFRLWATTTARPVRAPGAGVPRKIRELLAVAPGERNDGQKGELAAHYRSLAPSLKPVRDELAGVQQQLDQLTKRIRKTLVTVAVAPRMVRVLNRGNWMDDTGEVVEPGVPRALGAAPSGEGRLNRLDLAKWVVSPENPLTARVFVNRLWKQFFGAGLSRKLDDFGAQGEPPSHPELLDHLAGRFIDSGWNVKQMVREVVTSGAYRQSSIPPAGHRERDPFNRWLGHQGRFRLDAELVRDNALAVSGLLKRRVGGASVNPYQPAGYWAYLNFPMREWQNSAGEDLYRRGLYTHWQRQYLHPSLLAFDAPSREECTAERVRSNTPLQSLVLLNDPSYVEAARVFAQQLLEQPGVPAVERLQRAFERALNRAPRGAEQAVLLELLERHRAQYQAEPESARALLAVGSTPIPANSDPAELAAWTSVTRLILNLHETITRN